MAPRILTVDKVEMESFTTQVRLGEVPLSVPALRCKVSETSPVRSLHRSNNEALFPARRSVSR